MAAVISDKDVIGAIMFTLAINHKQVLSFLLSCLFATLNMTMLLDYACNFFLLLLLVSHLVVAVSFHLSLHSRYTTSA